MFIQSDSADPKTLIQEHNTFGKLIRTKSVDSDEGGVVSGYSVIDQPYLTTEIGPLNKDSKIKALFSNFW